MPLEDGELSDDEFRRLTAKRANEARKALVPPCNGIGTTLIAFAVLGTGATHLLDKAHEWTPVEGIAIGIISSLGIGSIWLATAIAGTIRSED